MSVFDIFSIFYWFCFKFILIYLLNKGTIRSVHNDDTYENMFYLVHKVGNNWEKLVLWICGSKPE